MASLSEILESLVARNPEEESVLHSVLGFAQSLLNVGQKDLGLITAVASTEEPALKELLTTLPETSRTQFFGLVEALEIYQSIHGRASSLVRFNEAAVAELRTIRELCLQGGTHALY
jgi:hypothetical protein